MGLISRVSSRTYRESKLEMGKKNKQLEWWTIRCTVPNVTLETAPDAVKYVGIYSRSKWKSSEVQARAQGNKGVTYGQSCASKPDAISYLKRQNSNLLIREQLPDVPARMPFSNYDAENARLKSSRISKTPVISSSLKRPIEESPKPKKPKLESPTSNWQAEKSEMKQQMQDLQEIVRNLEGKVNNQGTQLQKQNAQIKVLMSNQNVHSRNQIRLEKRLKQHTDQQADVNIPKNITIVPNKSINLSKSEESDDDQTYFGPAPTKS